MSDPIEFFVAGHPKGQPRVRAFVRGRHAGVYDPGTADDWKSLISIRSRDFVPIEPIESPLRVILQFFMPRPKSHFRKDLGLKVDAPVWLTGKPDCDNLAKAALDILTQVGFWRDDALVVDLRVGKLYGQVPGMKIAISELSNHQ